MPRLVQADVQQPQTVGCAAGPRDRPPAYIHGKPSRTRPSTNCQSHPSRQGERRQRQARQAVAKAVANKCPTPSPPPTPAHALQLIAAHHGGGALRAAAAPPCPAQPRAAKAAHSQRQNSIARARVLVRVKWASYWLHVQVHGMRGQAEGQQNMTWGPLPRAPAKRYSPAHACMHACRCMPADCLARSHGNNHDVGGWPLWPSLAPTGKTCRVIRRR